MCHTKRSRHDQGTWRCYRVASTSAFSPKNIDCPQGSPRSDIDLKEFPSEEHQNVPSRLCSIVSNSFGKPLDSRIE